MTLQSWVLDIIKNTQGRGKVSRAKMMSASGCLGTGNTEIGHWNRQAGRAKSLIFKYPDKEHGFHPQGSYNQCSL